MKLNQSQKSNRKNSFKRIFLVLLFLITSLLLSSCFLDSSEISTHMEMEILWAYYETFVLPNDPDARVEEISYYQFLHRYRDGKKHVYLIAWEVYDDTGEWQLIINDETFCFEHEVSFIVYQSSTKLFLSVEESIDKELFTIAEFTKALNNLDVFISNDSNNNG